MFKRTSGIKLSIIQGQETTGANSIAVWDKLKVHAGKTGIIFFPQGTYIVNGAFDQSGGSQIAFPALDPAIVAGGPHDSV